MYIVHTLRDKHLIQIVVSNNHLKPKSELKNKLNILLLSSFLLALILGFWVYYQTTHRIGDIKDDQNIDGSEFIICDEDRITQYYSIGTHYQGGEKTIKKELNELINNLHFQDSGILTYRFIVNCNNQIGRFRVKMVNSALKENSFKSNNIKRIQESIKNLNGWKAGKWKDKSLDSYYVLNFKIQNGRITDIF